MSFNLEELTALDKREYDVGEMAFIIEEYIKEVKGIQVSINPPLHIIQVHLFNKAFESAINYFQSKININEKETQQEEESH